MALYCETELGRKKWSVKTPREGLKSAFKMQTRNVILFGKEARSTDLHMIFWPDVSSTWPFFVFFLLLWEAIGISSTQEGLNMYSECIGQKRRVETRWKESFEPKTVRLEEVIGVSDFDGVKIRPPNLRVFCPQKQQKANNPA